MEIDDSMLATGKLIETTGTAYDFTQGSQQEGPKSHRTIGQSFPQNGFGSLIIFLRSNEYFLM